MGKSIDVDVAVIGAGSAGLNARREALSAGAESVVMIEGGPYGTTCARVGCMPSKVLIHAGDVAHTAAGGAEVGVETDGLRVDGKRVMERVRALRDRFAGGVVKSTEKIPQEQRLRGYARFTGPSTLLLEDGPDAGTEVRARAVVIATGSSNWTPPPLRGVTERIITSDEVFEMETLPASIGVVGAGIIGIELGQALTRLGVKTKFVALDGHVGPLTDPAVRDAAQAALGRELDLELGSPITGAELVPGGVEMRWTSPEGDKAETFEWLLVAAGRRPNVARLGLENAGVELNQHGLPIFDPNTMQCGDTPVFVAGDVSNYRPLLHEASDEGRIAGRNAGTFPEVKAHPRRTPLAVMFSDPQIAMAGATFRELEEGDRPYVVGEVNWGNQGRARVMAQNEGLLRVYGDAETGQLLGAEMIGPRAENIAHLLAWSIQQKMTAFDTLQMPFYHPVLEEGLRTALRGIAQGANSAQPLDSGCLDCGPWR